MRYNCLTLLVTLFVLPLTLPAEGHKRYARNGGITVVGTGEVAAPPDTVEFSVGALTQKQSASRALDGNNSIITSVRQVLEQFQIANRDLQTQRFDVSPQFKLARSNPEAPELIGYRVNHVLAVKLRHPERLGELLDSLLGAGANVLHGIRYSVGSPGSLIDQARERAVSDAHRKAKQLAAAGEVTLLRVVRMIEGAARGPSPFGHGAMEMRAMSAVPVAAGERNFTVRVTVTYAIE